MLQPILFYPYQWIESTNGIDILGYSLDLDQTLVSTNVYIELNPYRLYKLYGSNYDFSSLSSITVINSLVENQDNKTFIISRHDSLPESLNSNILASVKANLIEMFWYNKQIGHYSPLILQGYIHVQDKRSICKIELLCQEDEIIKADNHNMLIDDPAVYFFYDIETASHKKGYFPDAKNPNDHIFMISTIILHKRTLRKYIIIFGNITDELLKQFDAHVNIIKCISELELLQRYFSLLSVYKPDYLINYNGDSFDMPYIIKRCQYHAFDIPSTISKFYDYKVSKYDKFFIDYNNKVTVNLNIYLPETNTVDLIHFMRRFHYNEYNYKLDTISKKYLGQGKLDNDIDNMMEIVKSNNVAGMTELAKYSLMDSLLLHQLWLKINIGIVLRVTCADLHISHDDILTDSYLALINKIVCNIDPSVFFEKITSLSFNHSIESPPGYFRNLIIYDYTQLYYDILSQSKSKLLLLTLQRLGNNNFLLFDLFHCSLNDYKSNIVLLLDKIHKYTNIIVNMTQNKMIVKEAITKSWVKILDRINYMFVIDDKNYILLKGDNTFYYSGNSTYCKRELPLLTKMIEQFIWDKFHKNEPYIRQEIFTDITNYIYTVKIKITSNVFMTKKFVIGHNEEEILVDDINKISLDLLDVEYYKAKINFFYTEMLKYSENN